MRHRSLSLIAALVIGLSLGGALSTGCASGATPMRKGFTTISDSVAGAKAAMGAFNDRYQAGLQTEEDRTKALAAWAAFQGTVRVAETIAKDPNRTSDPIAVASDAAVNLLAFIATLTPKKTELVFPLFWPVGGLALGGAS